MSDISSPHDGTGHDDTAHDGTARQRILACSRKLFAQKPYGQVSLREISQLAHVSVALIIKHFHSKEELFAQTVDFTSSAQALFCGEFSQLGTTAVKETLTAPINAPYSMARMIAVASGNDTSLDAIGQRIKTDLMCVLHKRIAQEAPYPQPAPELRAQGALALLIGLSIMRRFGDIDFQQFSQASLLDYYGHNLQELLDGHP
ncbi:TetR/AcrR family transcriptional regulator [Corynebacterium sp. sy017]|uniref:TetR/AcrR family transcriptional regulator n=1 Tax=unclassified Corynebacterium TaxID=2624378 RepID=UPI001186C076|nr:MULTISPECIES: TetR/AcrR family transcriptional regulator [unclassified Corynebacterium]MBP3088312.1 TetR/AcrR family transcriptional regulator [Corynebacterium sp. sy017]TSD91635.1 TetR/AcrR family transcriptional regulator [Corynebacterium sp. SY003]